MSRTQRLLPNNGEFVLLVDDNPVSLAAMERALREKFTLCCARSAEEAVDILHERTPAMVILDVIMPDISGVDLCKLIKTTERLRDVPVVFLSACDAPKDFEDGYEAGGLMYMAKPIRAAEPLRMVRLYASRIEKKETPESASLATGARKGVNSGRQPGG